MACRLALARIRSGSAGATIRSRARRAPWSAGFCDPYVQWRRATWLLTTAAASCRNCLTIANEKDYGIKSVAFPAISCGVFGYPVPDAAAVALGTCAAYAGALESVTFMLFGQDTFDMFAAAASDQAGTLEPVSPDKLSK